MKGYLVGIYVAIYLEVYYHKNKHYNHNQLNNVRFVRDHKHKKYILIFSQLIRILVRGKNHRMSEQLSEYDIPSVSLRALWDGGDGKEPVRHQRLPQQL